MEQARERAKVAEERERREKLDALMAKEIQAELEI
jgi:hypothetical protein